MLFPRRKFSHLFSNSSNSSTNSPERIETLISVSLDAFSIILLKCFFLLFQRNTRYIAQQFQKHPHINDILLFRSLSLSFSLILYSIPSFFFVFFYSFSFLNIFYFFRTGIKQKKSKVYIFAHQSLIMATIKMINTLLVCVASAGCECVLDRFDAKKF